MAHQAHPHHPPPNRYTYGKPVQGKVQASLCQPFRHMRILHGLHGVTQKEMNCLEVGGQVSTARECGCHWDSPFPGLLLMGLTVPPDREERLLFNRGLVDCLQSDQLQVSEASPSPGNAGGGWDR